MEYWSVMRFSSLRTDKAPEVAAMYSAAAVLCLLFSPADAGAAETDKASSYVFSTYRECSLSGAREYDSFLKRVEAPVYNELIRDGFIASWSWDGHRIGGRWRRAMQFESSSLDGIFAVLDEIPVRYSALGDGYNRGNQCGYHDDYIWKYLHRSRDFATSDESVILTSLFACELDEESTADEVFERLLAPALNRAIEGGKLAGWGWAAQIFGGEYRRLLVLRGDDNADLVRETQKALIFTTPNVKGGKRKELSRFRKACNRKEDYLWYPIERPPLVQRTDGTVN